MKRIILIVLILSILAFTGCKTVGNVVDIFGPTCNTIQVPYEEKESYIDSEPYTSKECHNEDLKFTINWGEGKTNCIQEECAQQQEECAEYKQECARYDSVCVDTNFWGNCVKFEDRCAEYKSVCARTITKCVQNKCVKFQRTCELKIKNIDDTAGTWKVNTFWIDENKEDHGTGEKSVYVQPTEMNSILWEYAFAAGSSTNCKYNGVTEVPTKSVCENVIKYKDVTKYRTVTKYKQEEQCE